MQNVLDMQISFWDISLAITYKQLIVQILLPLLVILIGTKVLIIISRYVIKKSKWSDKTKQKLFRCLRRFIKAIAVILLGILLFPFLTQKIAYYFLEGLSFLTRPVIDLGKSKISIFALLLIIPVVAVANIFAKRIQVFTEKRIIPIITDNNVVGFSVANLLRYVFMVFFLILGLSLIGIDLSSIIIIFGVLGLGIGFGLQGTVENLFAGIVIIISRPIKIGDRIQLADFLGDVVTIKLLHTVITTVTNETLIVPNRELVSQIVHNYTYERDPRIVLTTTIQVDYNADLELVKDVLLGVLKGNPYRLKQAPEEPRVYLLSFDSSGISFKLVCWLKMAHDKLLSLSWINFEIWRKFAQHDICIPFPQLDVHLKEEEQQQLLKSRHENKEKDYKKP